MFSAAKIKRIYDIIKNYKGDNNQILYYQYQYKKGLFELTDFSAKYINENKNYVTKEINKTIKISSDFGEALKSKYKIDFIPNKLFITRVIGEFGNNYHCYAQYRQSVPPQLMFINKNYILTPLFLNIDERFNNIDFEKYDRITESSGRKLREHQKEGIKFLLQHKKCILADQQGLGKTNQAIVASIEGGFKHILIITTASLKTTWKKELENYINPNDICITFGSKWDGSKKYVITNYDILQNFYHIGYEEVEITDDSTGEIKTKLKKSQKKSVILENLEKSDLYKENFDCVIIDEAHKLSNKTSKRYKTISDFLKRSKPEDVFLLTGTPLTNRPMNLYNILCLLDTDIVNDYNYYCLRYCDGKKMRLRTGKEIMVNNGASHLDELCEKIKPLYIRRLQSEIPGMVNKDIITREYDLTEEQQAIYDKLWEEYLEVQKDKGNLDAGLYRDLVEGIIVRQYLAKIMIPNTIELTDSQINYGEKVIIVCTFQEEIDLLKEHYGNKAVIYNGKMNSKAKDKAVDEFMNNPSIMVFIANLTAVSLGLSLTVSHFLIFNSYSWQAAENNQAMDRIYRLTQTKDVTCIYQLFSDNISKDMFNKVMRKEEIMKQTIKSENEK